MTCSKAASQWSPRVFEIRARIVITKDTPFLVKEEKGVAFVLPFFLSFFLSFSLSFFLSFFLCASASGGCRRHEQKLQRHARGDVRVRGTVEVLLPGKRTGFEISRDRLLSSSERRDDETRPGRVHDEETTVLEMQTRTNDMRTRIRGNKGY